MNSTKMAKQSQTHTACQFQTEKTWLNLQFDGKKVKKPEELENTMRDPPEDVKGVILDRVHGSMIGMALGDILGAHVEFRPHAYLLEHPVEDLQGGGTWGLKIGQFTDDTSMALCLANSLIARGDYVPYDQLVRYKWWHRYGYMSSTGNCFDIGAATKTSLEEFEQRQESFAKQYNIPLDQIDLLSDDELLKKFPANCSEAGVAGNGALMRLAPVPLYFYLDPIYAVKCSGHSGEITHGDEKAYDACRYYGALIVAALHGETKDQLLHADFYAEHKTWFGGKLLHPDIQKIADGSFIRKDGYDGGIRGKGYIVDALEAALWAFHSTDSFQAGALAAVNLGDDTDTTAAIYGQLAGAFYGYDKLPKEWAKQVYGRKFIRNLSKWIVHEGKRWREGGKSVIDNLSSNEPRRLKNARKLFSRHKSKPNIPASRTTGSDARPNLRLTSRQSNEPSSDFRPRSNTAPDTPTSPDNQPNTELIYDRSTSISLLETKALFKDSLQTVDDVCEWLGLLGDPYKVYTKGFQNRNIDGFWLLNQVDDQCLIKCGVQNKEHRRHLMRQIEVERNNVS